MQRPKSPKILCLAVVAALMLATAGSAHAYSAAPGWSASDYVTGFAFSPGHGGPVGLAFDRSGNLFVVEGSAGSLHKAPPGGGTAASALLRGNYAGPGGLVFDKDGHLYMALAQTHEIVEINPSNGEIIRTVASDVACPVGLAVDPISGDLFASNTSCGGGIVRITGFQRTTGTATLYASVDEPDGLTFTPDGTLYAAGAAQVVRIAGTNSATPGAVSVLTALPGADGIAYAPASPSGPEFLVVVRTDGEIDRLGLDGSISPVVTGASRGDLVTVGPDQCMYADLQDRVIKIGPATGMCAFAPTGGGGGGGSGGQQQAVTVDTAVRATAPKRATAGQRFTLSVKVSNKSTNMAHAPKLTNTLPRGAKFVRMHSVKGVTCRRHGRTVRCGMRSLAARKSFTVRITVRPIRGSRWTNTARIRSSDLDPQPGNNKAQSRTMRR